MTKTSFPPVIGSQRMVLVVMGLGLAFMLASAIWQRIGNPQLVKEIDTNASASRQGMGGGMNPELGKLMQQVSENPNDFKALVHLAEHLMSDQQWEAAETFVRRAMTVNPADAQPPYLMGVILHNTGKNKEAAEALEQVVKLKDEASVRYSLGVLYIHYLDNPAKGVEHLSAGLHDAKAPESIKTQIREELEKAPLPGEKHKAPAKAGEAAKTAPPPAKR